MSQDDQQPIRCDGCDEILSLIEDNHWGMDPRYKGWKQKQSYWSLRLYFHIKDIEPGKRGPARKETENYHLCDKCKKRVCNIIGKDDVHQPRAEYRRRANG